jgi:hypothetical protein
MNALAAAEKNTPSATGCNISNAKLDAGLKVAVQNFVIEK